MVEFPAYDKSSKIIEIYWVYHGFTMDWPIKTRDFLNALVVSSCFRRPLEGWPDSENSGEDRFFFGAALW